MRKTLVIAAGLGAALALAYAGQEAHAGKGGKGKPGGDPPVEAEIAFVKRDALHTMGADGSGVVKVANISGIGQQPNWSPDGTQLVFNASIDGPGIYVVDADGSGLTKIASTATQYVSGPVWSPVAAPDGEYKILFSDQGTGGGRDIFAVNPDGTGRAKLTDTADATETHATWAPDADRFAAVKGFDDGTGWGYDVFVYDVGVTGGQLTVTGSSNVTAAANNPLHHSDIAFVDWAKTGDSIALAHYEGADYDLWIVDLADPDNPEQLTDTADVWERQPSWSPDDSHIAYWFALDRKNNGIHVIGVDGTGDVSLAAGGDAPDWKR